MKAPANEEELDELLSQPWQQTVDCMQRLQGDIMILGVAGKMGVTLAMMLQRAIAAAGVDKRVYGVARFSKPEAREQLERHGVSCIACDLLDRQAVAELPQVPNIIYMAGRKFGTGGAEALTWAMNVLVPHNVIEHFRSSRIVAFSTGCVYPLVSADSGGCTEEVAPAPLGEYAQSCLGRERVFDYAAQCFETPVCHYRLNYAVDMRYGVLHDIAQQVWQGDAVDASVPVFNVIWQGDANNHAILCLEHCAAPAAIMNVTGPELLETRAVAEAFGRLFGKDVHFSGEEQDRAYLNNASQAFNTLGPTTVDAQDLIKWQAAWIQAGNASLGKPTHFEVNTGNF